VAFVRCGAPSRHCEQQQAAGPLLSLTRHGSQGGGWNCSVIHVELDTSPPVTALQLTDLALSSLGQITSLQVANGEPLRRQRFRHLFHTEMIPRMFNTSECRALWGPRAGADSGLKVETGRGGN
jgi:hypothetical protein